MTRQPAALLVDPLLSVVMPAYNERATIDEIIRRVLAVPMRLELIVVDDGSTDGTRDRLQALQRELGFALILQPANGGKGAALRTGFTKVSGEIVIIQDADLEYSPEEYPSLNTMLTDMETCFKVMRAELRSMTLKSNGFGIEPELTAKIFKRGYRVYEIPITYDGRGYSEGKKITWQDGIVAIWTLLKYRFTE
jgi:glycosyltransferase involved in cell wall biosynthesis